MKGRTVEIVVYPSGSIEIEALGFQGMDCERATGFLEKALGQVAHRKRKPEFYQHHREKRVQRIGK